jgi:prepilin-type N-terminal cleavage/methylation domain-containing protein
MSALGERREPEDRDGGFTLIELLVAMGLFGVLSTVLLAFVVSTASTTDSVDRASTGVAEARLALERMARELRQASAVEAASISTDSVEITFWTDFDGDGVRDPDAVDPEVLTYKWSRATGQLTLSAGDSGSTVTRPVLAGGVTDVSLRLRSSLYQYDGNGDGTTTWQELDAAGGLVGNNNGVPDGPELDHVDLVSIRLKVETEGSARDFALQADLRNQEVD